MRWPRSCAGIRRRWPNASSRSSCGKPWPSRWRHACASRWPSWSSLKGELERLLGQVSADQQAPGSAQLIKVYEAMKAKSAAAIFDPMALELLLPIVRGMRETKVAAIIADMEPAKARALTAELARERPLPTAP